MLMGNDGLCAFVLCYIARRGNQQWLLQRYADRPEGRGGGYDKPEGEMCQNEFVYGWVVFLRLISASILFTLFE